MTPSQPRIVLERASDYREGYANSVQIRVNLWDFFLMFGPNTNFGCVTFMLERQAEYIARAVRRLMRERATAIDVRRSVMDVYNGMVDRSLSKSTQAANCHNYYYSASGRNVVWWPWRGTIYVLATRLCGFALFTRRAADSTPRT